jgi:hypothetical protein
MIECYVASTCARGGCGGERFSSGCCPCPDGSVNVRLCGDAAKK